MLGLETVVLLGVAPVACGALARQYPIAPAILLVLIGVLVRSNPHLKHAQLLPEVVLLSFPALLYWESLTTSLREIRNKPRVLPAESLLNDGTALRRGSTSTRCGSRTTTRPIEDGQDSPHRGRLLPCALASVCDLGLRLLRADCSPLVPERLIARSPTASA